MVGILKRLFGREDAGSYMQSVCALLVAHGFNPLWLEELLPGDPIKITRLFLMLHNRGFSHAEAAKIFELATHFYNENAERAKAKGWPLEHEPSDPAYSRSEAYFIEHVAHAAVAVKKHR